MQGRSNSMGWHLKWIKCAKWVDRNLFTLFATPCQGHRLIVVSYPAKNNFVKRNVFIEIISRKYWRKTKMEGAAVHPRTCAMRVSSNFNLSFIHSKTARKVHKKFLSSLKWSKTLFLRWSPLDVKSPLFVGAIRSKLSDLNYCL